MVYELLYQKPNRKIFCTYLIELKTKAEPTVETYAKRIRFIVSLCVASLAAPYFYSLRHKRRNFRKRKKLLNIKRVIWFSLQLFTETFLILRRIQRDITINIYRPLCKVSVIIIIFYSSLNFLDRFRKNFEVSNVMKICRVGASLFHADRQTDRHDTVKSRFSKFWESAY
jgi:hypothetical protein